MSDFPCRHGDCDLRRNLSDNTRSCTGIYAGRGTIFHFDDTCFLNILIMLLTSRLERRRRLPPFPLRLPLTKPSPAANATLTAFRAAHAAPPFSQLVRHSAHHARDQGTNYPLWSMEFNGAHVLHARQKKWGGKSRSRQPGLEDPRLHSLITADSWTPRCTCFPARPMLRSYEWLVTNASERGKKPSSVQPCTQDS